MKHDLDAFFLAKNAAERSAFNRVEHRMPTPPPLSHDFAGVVLPHNSFGNHPNNQNQIVDKGLEVKKITNAGEVLTEIWSQTVIDGHDTVAEYIHPKTNETPVLEKDQQWYEKQSCDE